MTRRTPRRARSAAPWAALVLTLALSWGCAHVGVGPSGGDLWRTFQDRRALAARDGAGILAAGSLNYSGGGQSHRLTLRLWGAPELPLRLDLAAGIGSTVAMLREESGGWVGYFPSEGAAYASKSALFGQRSLGLDLPFTLRELAGLALGTYRGFAPARYEAAEPAEDGGTRYELPSGGNVAGLTLDAQGRPVVFAGRLRGRNWTMTLSRHGEDPAAPPARIDIALEPDVRAVLRIKRLERRATPWPDAALELPLPPGTAVTPLEPHAGPRRG